MLEAVKDFFRKRCLAKLSSDVPTGIMPLRDIRTAVTFIDVEDTSFDKCKMSIQAFYRENGIKGEVFFFDFRKLDSEERLITSITNTVLRRDLNWFGKPSEEKLELLKSYSPDLFISLIRSTGFPLECMAKFSGAKFKIGRVQLPGDTFDMVISDSSDNILSEDEIFSGVKTYLSKIG
ncbi:MAG: hypothetical protein IJ795_07480 [Bacteroidales bacterium]|nr:hypothetical protein [Bacteroidales bacterium]